MAVRWLRTSQGISAFALALTLSWAADATRVHAQTAAPAAAANVAGGIPVTASSGRKLAADAIHVIPPGGELGDTFIGPVELPLAGAADWTPNFAPPSETLANMVKSQIFRSQIWSMEFSFKPVRMIGVDLPDADGQVKTKVVWYLLYSVRYLGGDLASIPQKDQYGSEVFEAGATPGVAARRFIQALRCIPRRWASVTKPNSSRKLCR